MLTKLMRTDVFDSLKSHVSVYEKMYQESYKGLIKHAIQDLLTKNGINVGLHHSSEHQTTTATVNESSSKPKITAAKKADQLDKKTLSELKVLYDVLENEMMNNSTVEGIPLVPSKLQREYEMLGDLGKGGFGSVLKVRNKVDKMVYAVKRIKFKHKGQRLHSTLREVRSLAKLDHQNVCRWV